MIELTQHQLQWLQDNTRDSWKIYAISWCRMAVLATVITGFSWVAFFNGHEIVGNISKFIIALYIICLCVGGVMAVGGLITIRTVEIAHQELEELVRGLNTGEEWRGEPANRDYHRDRQTKQTIDKIYRSMARLPLPISWKYYAFVGADMALDVALFSVLVISGWAFTACIAGVGCLFNWWIYKKLRKKLVNYVKNLTPPEGQQESIDDLAERLFNDTDQL